MFKDTKSDSTYQDKNGGFYANEAGGNFKIIRMKSVKMIINLPEEERNELHKQLNSGTAILQTEAQADSYMFSLGKMHQAKLISSFEKISSSINLPDMENIDIIDYGCGQGLGTIVFLDYVRSVSKGICIKEIKLVEPSDIALRRAMVNVKSCFKNNENLPSIKTLNNKLDEVGIEQLSTGVDTIKFHIFSNILDVDDFDTNELCEKIHLSQSGVNIFICVSPLMERFSDRYRNSRLDNVMDYFTEKTDAKIISYRKSKVEYEGKTCERNERLFCAYL